MCIMFETSFYKMQMNAFELLNKNWVANSKVGQMLCVIIVKIVINCCILHNIINLGNHVHHMEYPMCVLIHMCN